MTWVIAILLGLILVAMVSSNQAAAAGVWTVVRFVGWGAASLLVWGLLVGYSVWYYETYSSVAEWTRMIGVAFAVIIPPILLWFSRKNISAAYKKDKWATFKSGAILAGFVLGLMVTGVVVREVQAAYEFGGWAMILIPFVITGAILTWRSCTSSLPRREIWFGPPDVPEPWLVVGHEQDAFDLAERAAVEKMHEMWNSMTSDQQDAASLEHQARVAATNVRLDALREKLEAEKRVRNRYAGWTVTSFFWIFVCFAAFGLIGIVWDHAFLQAMELKFVKGQAWLAGTVVVVAAMALGGLCVSFWESIAEGNAKKP